MESKSEKSIKTTSSGWKKVEIAPIPVSKHTRNFMKWEDESAKANWIICPNVPWRGKPKIEQPE